MASCVYCRRMCNRSGFNKEHVLPEQLGTFENNFTLRDTVCRKCNQYFGDTIENSFGRHSLEAVFRLIHGQKSVADMNASPKFVKLTIPEPSMWAGAILEITALPGKDAPVVTLPPQVGFRRRLALRTEYVTKDVILQDERLLTESHFGR